ncbi:Multidrug resistance efflux pump [Oryzisolibacter propanilivorax]|uniref:Multidrug resistance efflux pump n=1 Tax=Oryzisolibacter propanilivorax TaxID=1527607 RepID=A0A1G9PEF0_9BURK|nr:Multidrug resistance efflux pump [Oryzisolibacter propanilivorax]
MNQPVPAPRPVPPDDLRNDDSVPVDTAGAQPLADGANDPQPAPGAEAPAPAPTAPAPAPSAAPKTIKPSRTAVIAMLLVALVGVLLILWAWRLGPFATAHERTDNAYVRGQITVLAPQVSGHVAEVLVHDFQRVAAGQLLVRIDDRVYLEKVHAAEAQLASAQAQLANFGQTQAQNQATLGSRRATLLAAQAEAQRAQTDLKRADDLAARGSVSLRERDQARATFESAQANVRKARADITIAEQAIKSTTVSRAGLQAQVQAAEAQLGLAKIDLANTEVRAPRAGQLSEVGVRLGQYVTAGSQLLFLVPDTLWVVANFKETQTAHMHVGQHARFTVDALSGETLTGRVTEIAPATGSEFSVLRSDNATGNFTKVVQRLPVRIQLDPGQALAARLRPGMSVVAEVDTASDAGSQAPQVPSAEPSTANAPLPGTAGQPTASPPAAVTPTESRDAPKATDAPDASGVAAPVSASDGSPAPAPAPATSAAAPTAGGSR